MSNGSKIAAGMEGVQTAYLNDTFARSLFPSDNCCITKLYFDSLA